MQDESVYLYSPEDLFSGEYYYSGKFVEEPAQNVPYMVRVIEE